MTSLCTATNFFGGKYDLIQLYRQIDMAARAFCACFGSADGQAKSAQELKIHCC